MSYDVSIADRSFNYTYNLGDMFRDHMDEDKGIRVLHGLTGKQALQFIDTFWSSLAYERETDVMKKYDSPNGWGTAFGAIVFISMIQNACAAYPRHRITVS